MALDYRTPCPRKPKNTTTKFARFGCWTVQKLSPYPSTKGKWLANARRVNRTAAIEWAMGHCSGLKVAVAHLDLDRSTVDYEEVWVVGPDGHGYYCLEAPNLRSLNV